MLGTGNRSHDVQGRGLPFSSMTALPFVRKIISVLPSLSTNAVSGFLGDTAEDLSPSLMLLIELIGKGFPHAITADLNSDLQSRALINGLDHDISMPIHSHTHADFSFARLS